MKHYFLIWLGWIALGTIIGTRLYQNISVQSSIFSANGSFVIRQDFKNGLDGKFWTIPPPYKLGNTCLLLNLLKLQEGFLALTVTEGPSFCDGDLFPYQGGAISTRQRFPIPFRVTGRMKAPSGAGIVSSLYTYTDPLDGNPHFENDIEFPGRAQEPAWLWTNNYRPLKDPEFGDSQKIKLKFDPTKSFNEYTIEVYNSVTIWRVNGSLVRLLKRNDDPSPQKVLMNTWYTKFWSTFSGISNFEGSGTPFVVDWIEIASLPARPGHSK